MKNFMLNYVYKLLYKESFDYNDFGKRLKMQKGIYLLQEMGYSLGNYKFSWYKHGPYSQQLLDDSYNSGGGYVPSRVEISNEAKYDISRLASALITPDNNIYSNDKWAECLGSIRYIKENILNYGASYKMVLDELVKRKPYLNNEVLNNEALNRVDNLFY